MYNDEKINAIKKWLGPGTINIFGRPFAGKDAQGKRLSELLGGNLIGGGEILRNSTISDRVKGYMHAGKLIPSDDYVDIVLPYLSQPRLADQPLILSAVGRWRGEEDGVVRAVSESGHPLKAVIYLNISTEESRNRWLALQNNNDRTNRHDDTKESLDIRFAEFQEKTLPVLNYYRTMGILVEIDGKGARDEITENIIKILAERAKIS